MTELYLIRHGLAADRNLYDRDADRPLTETGQRKTRAVAKQLQHLGLRFDRLLASPLVRADQTAVILQEQHLAKQIETADWLMPEADLGRGIDWLEQWRPCGESCLGLVGHEPHLSHLAEQLIWGEVRDVLILKKAGVIGLTLPDTGALSGNCQLFWLTPPRLLIG